MSRSVDRAACIRRRAGWSGRLLLREIATVHSLGAVRLIVGMLLHGGIACFVRRSVVARDASVILLAIVRGRVLILTRIVPAAATVGVRTGRTLFTPVITSEAENGER